MKQNQTSAKGRPIALFGGSFDPVHSAHLKIAQAALEQLNLDAVIFIPAAQSPLKAITSTVSDVDRIKMLQLATSDEPRFEVDTGEIMRGGLSYTIETVKSYRSRYPDDRLHWIIGADQFEQLPQWHEIEDLVTLLSFIVIRRPGHSIAKSPLAGLSYVEVKAPLMSHSSSQIRALLAKGLSVEDLLPPSVEAFISTKGLYTR